jgi:hypothetical protein
MLGAFFFAAMSRHVMVNGGRSPLKVVEQVSLANKIEKIERLATELTHKAAGFMDPCLSSVL